MKRRRKKAAVLLAGMSWALLFGTLPGRAGSPAGQESEEDGVTIPQGHKEAYEAAEEQRKEALTRKHRSGAWFLTAVAGTAFPQTDSGQLVNNATGLGTGLSLNSDLAFVGGLAGGYYWHDPERWGKLSFTAEAVAVYLGSSINTVSAAAIQGAGINAGFLGAGGTLGYRVGKSWEPFVGLLGGGAVANVSRNGMNFGTVWGDWFAPARGSATSFRILTGSWCWTGCSSLRKISTASTGFPVLPRMGRPVITAPSPCRQR